MIDRVLDGVARALLVLAAVHAFALSFLVVADVVGRSAFNSPVKGTPEMVSISIVIICFLQAAYAIRSGSMLNVDFVLARFSPRMQSYVSVVGALFGMLFFGLVGWGGLGPLEHAWDSGEFEGEGALRVPSWPARFVIVVGGALCALSYLLLAIRSFQAARAGRGPSLDPASSPH